MSDSEPTTMKIEELTPFVKQIEVSFKVINKGESREITSKRSGETHVLSDIKVADSTGSIILTLWDDDIDRVEEEKVYTLSNCYVNVFQNSMRLSKGKHGVISDSNETIDEVNLENDISAKHVDAPRPHRRRRYNRDRRKQD